MSLEKILKKITDDAREEAERIIQESRERAEQIKKDAGRESSVLAEAIIQESEKDVRLEISRILTQARLEGNIKILSSKKEMIDRVIDSAFRQAVSDRAHLKKEVIDKKGRSQQNLDEKTLVNELRPKFEKFIADLLKI